MTFGFHAAALIDLLGQQDALRRVEFEPNTDVRRADLEKSLRESVGRVVALRTLLDSLVKGYGQSSTDLHLAVRSFSDTCFLSAPLSADGNLLVAMERLLAVMGGCAASLATSLSGGMAIRGGLTVGTALEFSPGEIYGPVLADVYSLEQSAGYPRIVIGPRLLEMLAEVKSARETRALAELAESLVFTDFDGRHALDFLGPGARRLFATGSAHVDVDAILSFIGRQRQQFERDRNGKLAERYWRLGDYVTARRPLWVSADQ
jgi:hypothetical protein